MRKHWLKLIGGDGKPCEEFYALKWTVVHFRKCSPRIHSGDRMVLYACGGSKHIFANAEVTSEVGPTEPGEWGHYKLAVDYTIKLPVSVGVHIAEVNVERNLLPQGSYLELSQTEYDLAVTKLREAERNFVLELKTQGIC